MSLWVSELVSEYEVNQVIVRFRNMLRRFQTLWHFAKCWRFTMGHVPKEMLWSWKRKRHFPVPTWRTWLRSKWLVKRVNSRKWRKSERLHLRLSVCSGWLWLRWARTFCIGFVAAPYFLLVLCLRFDRFHRRYGRHVLWWIRMLSK